MDSSYTALLERIRVPQPSLQKLAVISIFEKLRASPSHLNCDSNPGRDAISQCLNSESSPVVDQSVRELCRLVKYGTLDTHRALFELQSALQASSHSRFLHLFVKAIGFLVRVGFRDDVVFNSHPFITLVASRIELQSELSQQVLSFILHNKDMGLPNVLSFLRPFFNFSILKIPFTPSYSSFARQLLSSIASLAACPSSIPSLHDRLSLFSFLLECLTLFPRNNPPSDFKDVFSVAECLVDAYTVVLMQLVNAGSLKDGVQLYGVELAGTLLSFYTDLNKLFVGMEAIVELVQRLLLAQKQLGLQYCPELSSVLTSIFIILVRTEFEHEQLSLMKLSIFLLKWERENNVLGRNACTFSQEIIFMLPVISLLSSPSGSVKAAATDMLSVLEKALTDILVARKQEPVIQEDHPSISQPESSISRLWQRLWFQEWPQFSSAYFLSIDSSCRTKDINIESQSWLSCLRNYSLLKVERQKSVVVSQRQEISTEMSFLLSSVAAGLVMHHSLGSYAVDALVAIGIMDPRLGLSQLLCILFYSKILCDYENCYHDILLKLLEALPLLASHSAMPPLIVQTIFPMLKKDAKPVMRATATRLLCKTWEVTDCIFGSIQDTLNPKAFSELSHEKDICISLAASIRDICRKNPDRGVDIILSVSACIESSDSTVQALGFQSLGYLCEADVVDFYTAWNIIAEHVVDYSSDPIVAQGMCMLLKWGAMDAEAFTEASKTVLEILWDVGTCRKFGHGSKWLKAQCSAIESLTQFEVEYIQSGIPDFKTRNIQFLVSEDNADVLAALEGLEVKIINFQHKTRSRHLKEKRTMLNKVEKLLESFPKVIFYSGNGSGNARDLPGAALLCLDFTPKVVQNQGASKEILKLHAAYETALVDIAESMQLSRDILVAILSLQSWKPFIKHWMEAIVMLPDAKVNSATADKTTKAAADIFKILKRKAEVSIPRSSENIALAIGALCMVLPLPSHTVTTNALKFLLEWLFQFEHEHRQWSAAITLGLVSSCLHTTDHKQKFDIINGLLKITCSSKSMLVKGACGVGLGFASQDLLTRFGAGDGSNSNDPSREKEFSLVCRIIRAISTIICQMSPASSGSLYKLLEYFPLNPDELVTDLTSAVQYDCVGIMDEDGWGIAGLVLGLGNSVSAIYRVGGQDAVIMLKTLLVSWIPHVDSVGQNIPVCNLKPERLLSVGSCLALPVVLDFCLSVDLVTDDELIDTINGFKELISDLLSLKKSSSFHQCLLMASCIGAGGILSSVLDGGVHSMSIEDVKYLLELFRKCYTNQYPSTIHFGGMLGVVNALGAGAGILTYRAREVSSLQHGAKDSSYIRGPILLAPICEQLSESLLQEIFLSAQISTDKQLRKYAAWSVSLLRHKWWSKESHIVENNSLNDPVSYKPVSHTFPEDSVVWQLCLWLEELSYIKENIVHVSTVASVLRCLSQATKLPYLDWGAIIRRCMKYEDRVYDKLPLDSSFKKGALREECIIFALAHASNLTPLLSFLDELSEFSRFRTLELNLQSCLLCHLPEIMNLFTGSRTEKLFGDMAGYFSSSSSFYQVYSPQEKNLLRISFWKGLYKCCEEASSESVMYIKDIEKCMELLFATLPVLCIDGKSGTDLEASTKEWSEAVRCMAKASRKWLMDILEVSQIPKIDIGQGGNLSHVVLKKIEARVKLVMIGSIPLTELGMLRTPILHTKPDGIWDVLVQVVSVLRHAEDSIKRQWLINAVEISCVTNYPSTALIFIGLLAGCCCKYMPLLVLEQVSVLCDLPVTLPSLLSDSNWIAFAEPIVFTLWRSTERIFNWAKCLDTISITNSDEHNIDKSENNRAVLITRVMHQTCLLLRDYLPFEMQLELANMVVPGWFPAV